MENIINHTPQELGKSSIEKMALAIANEAKAGISDPLEMLAKIEFIKKVCDKVRKDISDLAIDGIYDYPGQQTEIAGIQIDLRESGVKYDYSDTPYWNELKEQENEAIQKRKDFEKILQATKVATTWADPETGEMIEIKPPVRTSGNSLFFTAK